MSSWPQRRIISTTMSIPTTLLLVLLAGSRVGSSVATVADGECLFNVTEPAPDGAQLDGDVLVAGGLNELRMKYPPSQYRRTQDGGFVLCTCEFKVCVIKCCKTNHAWKLELEEGKCAEPVHTSIESLAVPKLVKPNGTVDSYETDKFVIVYDHLNCIDNTDIYLMNPTDNEDNVFRIAETGVLLNKKGHQIAPVGQFCLEKIDLAHPNVLPVVMVCKESDKESNKESQTTTDGIHTILIIGMYLSLPLFFLTFLVYALLERLQNMHGKSLMCHVAALFVAYGCLITNTFSSDKIGHNTFCHSLGYTMQFSFMACFLWLNVMCFDLWEIAYSGIQPNKEHESKRFRIYLVYAWGLAAMFSLFTMYMNSVPSNFLFISVHPGIGENACWFNEDSALVLYFYGPIFFILLSNLIMFIHMSILISRQESHLELFNNPNHKRNMSLRKRKFWMIFKLFGVMGITWISEVMNWFFQSHTKNFPYIWYLPDIANSMQGVLIFYIFVCNKRVLRMLTQKFCPQWNFFQRSTYVTSNNNGDVSRLSSTDDEAANNVNVNLEINS